MRSFQILGQSNYAISILLDCLTAIYPNDDILADIVANIPPEQNDSLAYDFTTPGVQHRIWMPSEWRPVPDAPCLVGSIGKSRKAIVDFFEQKFHIGPGRYMHTIHPSAVVASTVKTGYGIHISPLSVVAPYAELGNFVVINRTASIGHHTVLGDFVTVNPGAHIAGVCHIGASAVIGAGATVIDRIRIGANTVVGAGSVVTRDLPSNAIAYGSPAKVVREIV